MVPEQVIPGADAGHGWLLSCLHRSIIISVPEPVREGWQESVRLEFPNVASAFIDGDNLYGRSREVLDKLRSHKGGKFLLTSLTSPRVGPIPPYRGYRSCVDPQTSLETMVGALPMHSAPTELSAIATPDGAVDERLQVSPVGEHAPPPGYFPFVGSLFPTKTATAAFYLALSGIPVPAGDPSTP